MRFNLKSLLALALGAALALPALAQSVTTGALAGQVVDESGGVLPGATVVGGPRARPAPATRPSRPRGRALSMLNVRVGGPYTLEVTCPASRTQKQGGFSSPSARSSSVAFQLQPRGLHRGARSSTPSRRAAVQPLRTGATANVAQEALATLPTDRPLHSRTSRAPRPTSTRSASGDGSGATSLSVAGPQQPLQQHPDRRRGQQRPVRPRRHRHARRPGGDPADQPRRGPGAAAARLALRRAPGRLLRRRRQRHHQERHQRLPRLGLLLHPQREPGRRRAPTERPFAEFTQRPVRRQPRRPDRQGQGVLLHRTARSAARTTPAGYSVDGASGQDFGPTPRPRPSASCDILQSKYGYDPGRQSTSPSAAPTATSSSVASTSTSATSTT